MDMKIKELCEYGNKSIIKAGEGLNKGKYLFFTSSSVCNKYLENYQFNKPGIIMGTGGNATLHYCDKNYSVSTDCIVLFPNDNLNCKYLFYFFKKNMNILEAGFKGAGLRHTSKKYIDDIEIDNIPNLFEQKKNVSVLDKILSIIEKRKIQIDKLDNLIKSRFVEMFGDPVINPRNWEMVELSELADIKIGPFGTLLHKEDYISEGHPLVNPSHIIDGKICYDIKLTVSDEKYEELEPYILRKGDLILGRRGEMGRCAVVNEEGLLCGTGSLIIRSKGEISADIMQKIISFPSYKKTIEDKAVGQTMPNLNVPIVSRFLIPRIPGEVQEEYFQFVQQVDKLKVEAQKSLDEMQVLFDSLMQKYFG